MEAQRNKQLAKSRTTRSWWSQVLNLSRQSPEPKLLTTLLACLLKAARILRMAFQALPDRGPLPRLLPYQHPVILSLQARCRTELLTFAQAVPSAQDTLPHPLTWPTSSPPAGFCFPTTSLGGSLSHEPPT